MTTAHVVALLLAFFFVASPVLFATAILRDERDQQPGFLFSSASLILFFVTCSDRLPGAPDLRGPLAILGGGSTTRHTFVTPTWGLWLLLAVYGVRFVVWVRLKVVARHTGPEDMGVEDDLYDEVAILLSYLGLVVCVVLTLEGTYALNSVGTVAVGAVGVTLYFARLLGRLADLASLVRDVSKYVGGYLRDAIESSAYLLVILLARVAQAAHAGPATPLRATGLASRNSERKEAALRRRKRESSVIAATAKKLTRMQGGRS